MQKASEPTSSTLQLVANDMTDIMEKLDTHELDLDDGLYDTADASTTGVTPSSARRSPCARSPRLTPPLCVSAGERLPFTAVYHTVGFKEPEAKIFLSRPITAKILEVERFTSAQDRFHATTQRSVNKVPTFPRTCRRISARIHLLLSFSVVQNPKTQRLTILTRPDRYY